MAADDPDGQDERSADAQSKRAGQPASVPATGGARTPAKAAPSPPILHVVLRPHRSLGPRGFLWLMGILSAVCFVAGAIFAALGAWPVFGFFGLDVLIIYLAFRANYRAARICEVVRVDRDVLQITRIDAKGRKKQTQFNPVWARVSLPVYRNGRNELAIVHHARRFSFARFLTDAERAAFADELRGALLTARGGPRI